MLACARLALGPAERECVKQCLESGLDWDGLLQLASRHRLLPLLCRHLKETTPAYPTMSRCDQASPRGRDRTNGSGSLGGPPSQAAPGL